VSATQVCELTLLGSIIKEGKVYIKYIPTFCMKKDSRTKTAVEVLIDTAIACGIATGLNYTILPHYIDTIESGEPLGMLSISFWYVGASLIRKYLTRRWFVNRNITKSLQNLTKFIKYRNN